MFNFGARVISGRKKFDHISDVLACFQFNRDRVERETRQSSHLSLPRPRTSHGKRSFVYRGSQLFNSVCMTLGPPQEMSYGNFKKAIREMLYSE